MTNIDQDTPVNAPGEDAPTHLGNWYERNVLRKSTNKEDASTSRFKERSAAMKLIRFDEGKTGLVVELPTGPHVIDIIASLPVMALGDAISPGVLNGLF